MMSADSSHNRLHNTIIISSDAEMNEHQFLIQKLYSVYEALFNDSKIINQRIYNIFKTEYTKRKVLKEEVQHLHAEMTRKNEQISELETEI
ncbi:hypothetical protein EMCG_03578, partial [[Emmonsia] crescens]